VAEYRVSVFRRVDNTKGPTVGFWKGEDRASHMIFNTSLPIPSFT